MIEILKQIIIFLGIPAALAVLGAFIYVGRKLQVLDSLEASVKSIKNNMKVVCDSLIKAPIEFDHERLETFSPIRLKEEGRIFLEKVGFMDVVGEHAEDFFKIMDLEQPKTKFDVEALAKRSVMILLDREYFKDIKVYLFNNPKERLSDVTTVMGIYIRDKYLENHPEIME